MLGAFAMATGLVSIRSAQVKRQLASFEPLNARYAAWGEPVPPNPCRRPDEVAFLLEHADDAAALAARENPSPELRYLEARLAVSAGRRPSERFGAALTCPGFAAAVLLAAQVAAQEGRPADARLLAAQALELAPEFERARALAQGAAAPEQK